MSKALRSEVRARQQELREAFPNLDLGQGTTWVPTPPRAVQARGDGRPGDGTPGAGPAGAAEEEAAAAAAEEAEAVLRMLAWLLVPFLLSANIAFPVATVVGERLLYLPRCVCA